MARKARVEFAGARYHLLDRGDRREAIFRDEPDQARFFLLVPKLRVWERTLRGKLCFRGGSAGAAAPAHRHAAELPPASLRAHSFPMGTRRNEGKRHPPTQH